MIKIKLRGSFKNTERFFTNSGTLKYRIRVIFQRYGQLGVEALRQNTPKDTGETANKWNFQVTDNGIIWTNSNVTVNGTPIAILLQYGHGTRGGGYVQGLDYINPALKPIFDQISEACWKEVQNL